VVSIEEQFYFLWPGVLKRRYRHRAAIVVAVLVVAPLLHVVQTPYRVLNWPPWFGWGKLAIACICGRSLFAPIGTCAPDISYSPPSLVPASLITSSNGQC
jgi:peptidoglycan/LPS O-acetylase OafA/YrhL